VDRYETIRVQLTGSHYQPKGCDKAFVSGIFWDKEHKHPALQLTYENGKTNEIPLSELGSSSILGDVIIVNSMEKEEK